MKFPDNITEILKEAEMNEITARKTKSVIRSIARNGIIPSRRLPKYLATLRSNDVQGSPDKIEHDGVSAFMINPPFTAGERSANLVDSQLEDRIHLVPVDFHPWGKRGKLSEDFYFKEMREIPIRGFDARFREIMSSAELSFIGTEERAVSWMVLEDTCFRRPLDNFMQIAFERPVIPVFPEKDEVEQRFRRSIICLCGIEKLKIFKVDYGTETYVKAIPPKNIRAILAPSEVFQLAKEAFACTRAIVMEVSGTRRELLKLYRFPFRPEYMNEDEYTIPDYLPVIHQMVTQDPSLAIGHLVRLPTDYDMKGFNWHGLLKHSTGVSGSDHTRIPS